MLRWKLTAAVLASVLALAANSASGQIAFSVTQQNGVVTGGGLRIGGVINHSRTGVSMGIGTQISQQVIQDRLIGQSLAVAINARRNRQVTVEQFVLAARQFDQDGDERLDQDELQLVAAAFIAELQQRTRNSHPAARRARPAKPSAPVPSKQEMIATFVRRSLDFDTDNDQALDTEETTRMATALIRSLLSSRRS